MLLDCTIRDGGFENNFNFTTDEVKNTLRASSEIGYNYFEMGYLTDPKILTEKLSDSNASLTRILIAPNPTPLAILSASCCNCGITCSSGVPSFIITV